jgi:PIN domain nuclease of toxin-antitoxin system
MRLLLDTQAFLWFVLDDPRMRTNQFRILPIEPR